MDNLKKSIIYFVQQFPQKLGRTKLIKAIYLLDCEWYKIYNQTFSGLKYSRDYNGPFDTMFYEAKDELCDENFLFEFQYTYPGGKGYEFHLGADAPEDAELNTFARYICDDIVEELGGKDLQGFLSKAYSTAPMVVVQEKEKQRGQICYGEELNMNELIKPPKPLFSMSKVKAAAKRLDLSNRGSDQEYAETVNQEIEELLLYRERAADSWKLIQ